MHLLPTLAPLFLSCGAAYLMMGIGVRKHALQWRRGRRSCPACRKHIGHGCRCRERE